MNLNGILNTGIKLRSLLLNVQCSMERFTGETLKFAFYPKIKASLVLSSFFACRLPMSCNFLQDRENFF